MMNLAEWRHTFAIYQRLLRVQIRSQLQFRAAFVLDMMATAMIVLVEFGATALVLQRFDNIQGWTIAEVALLYGLVEVAFGTMDLLFSGFDYGRFGQEVRRGTFDQILLRPINVTAQVLGSDLALRRLGKITLGVVILGYGVQQAGVAWTAVKLLLIPLSIASMIAFFGGLFVIGATITFWTVASIEVMNILTYGGSYTLSYPMSIYPDWIRRFFTFVLPAIFLNYYPALTILDKPDPFNMPAIAPFLSPLVGLTVLLLALRFWHFGIGHYQSTGS